MEKFFRNIHPRSVYHFLWAWTGAHLHGHPSKKLFVIGVTGTKGKTTTIEVINAILEAAGKRTALISSLRMKVGDESKKNTIGQFDAGPRISAKIFAPRGAGALQLRDRGGDVAGGRPAPAPVHPLEHGRAHQSCAGAHRVARLVRKLSRREAGFFEICDRAGRQSFFESRR